MPQNVEERAHELGLENERMRLGHYEAKHEGLIPVIFVKCEQCGAQAGWDLNNKRCVVAGCPSAPAEPEETQEQRDGRAGVMRATEAIAAVDAYGVGADPAQDASDLIADLMHYAEHHGLDWGGLTVRAHRHYRAER